MHRLKVNWLKESINKSAMRAIEKEDGWRKHVSFSKVGHIGSCVTKNIKSKAQFQLICKFKLA